MLPLIVIFTQGPDELTEYGYTPATLAVPLITKSLPETAAVTPGGNVPALKNAPVAPAPKVNVTGVSATLIQRVWLAVPAVTDSVELALTV